MLSEIFWCLLIFLSKKKDDFFIIVKVGTLITDKVYQMLLKQKKLFVSDKDKKKVEFGTNSILTYIKHNKNDLEKSVALLYEVTTSLFEDYIQSEQNIIDTEGVASIVKSVIFLIESNENYLKHSIEYLNHEHTLATHSMHVAIYAIYLGFLLKLDNEHLKKLGLAALLHDLGLKKIEDITEKDKALTIKEMELVSYHPVSSMEIATHNYIHDPYVLEAIRHHHENHNGTGYPDRLRSAKITQFASILSISDVFDALTSDRAYREKMSTFEALNLMLKDPEMMTKFNTSYLNTFLRAMI